jgi:hypothetical protein
MAGTERKHWLRVGKAEQTSPQTRRRSWCFEFVMAGCRPDRNARRPGINSTFTNHLRSLTPIPTFLEKAVISVSRNLSAVISADRGLLK